MMTRTLAITAMVVGWSCSADAQPSGASISGQGQSAVAAAEALADQVLSRVNASASHGSTPGIVARTRAFYDVLRSEAAEFEPVPGYGSEAASPGVTVASVASLLAEPGGRSIATAQAGDTATVLDSRGQWRKVILDSGAVGWLRQSDLRSPGPAGPLTSSRHDAISATIRYPEEASTAAAIRRMASGQVSALANLCARSVREALGWGLGDAAQWADRLPAKGFTKRPAGQAAQPGDIVVWPFTFGSARRQHIGFAVEHDGRVVLLSNLNGRIRLSSMSPGYSAFAPK